MENLLLNPWLLALYGWFVYQCYILFIKDWRKIDLNKNGFIEKEELLAYFKKRIGITLFSFVCIPLGVVWVPHLWESYTGFEFVDASYMLAGLASVLVEVWLRKKNL